MNSTLVIFQVHAWDWFSRRACRKIRRQLAGYADVVALGHSDNDDLRNARSSGESFIVYSRDDLLRLPYPAKTAGDNWSIMDGHTDLLLLAYWYQHPGYDYYWVIEYDVRYTGNWRRFIASFEDSPADVLATNVLQYDRIPDWSHWQRVVAPPGIPWKAHATRAFMPIGRFSSASCRAVDEAYRSGWGGHNEALWATIAIARDLVVEDIGGKGPFTPAHRWGKHYSSTPTVSRLTPGTFGYRPAKPFAPPLPRGLLWHPVKLKQSYWMYRARIRSLLDKSLAGWTSGMARKNR